MITVNVYDEKSGQLTSFLVTEDDRSFQTKCVGVIHEFAPSSLECACRKYTDINGLRQAGKPSTSAVPLPVPAIPIAPSSSATSIPPVHQQVIHHPVTEQSTPNLTNQKVEPFVKTGSGGIGGRTTDNDFISKQKEKK